MIDAMTTTIDGPLRSDMTGVIVVRTATMSTGGNGPGVQLNESMSIRPGKGKILFDPQFPTIEFIFPSLQG